MGRPAYTELKKRRWRDFLSDGNASASARAARVGGVLEARVGGVLEVRETKIRVGSICSLIHITRLPQNVIPIR